MLERFQITNIYVIAAIAVVGGGLFGFDISSMSAQQNENSYNCYFNQGPLGPPPFDPKSGTCSGPKALVQGGIVAAMPAGSWLGALVSGFLSDRIGRRASIIVGCWIWLVGSAIICSTHTMAQLIVGRILNGISVGVESAQVPVYISELAPPSKRGRLVGLQQWAITWGILIMFYISYGCSYIGEKGIYNYDPQAWRVPWGLQMIPAFLLHLGMLVMPESPRWLASKDRWEEAHEVLARVHAKGDRSHPFVAIELQDIRNICEVEKQAKNITYLDLFRPRMINRTLIGLMVQIWSQLTGMNVMMYYITFVFGMAGYSGDSNLLASSIQYIINVVMTLPALLFMDYYGRRNSMLVGFLLMAVFMYANGAIMATHGQWLPLNERKKPEQSMRLEGSAAKGLIACTYLFVASYAPTVGPVSWAYPPELYPLRFRGKAVGLATSGNWIFNMALGLFTPSSFANITWRTYMIFGTFNAAALVHCFFLFPETSGKSLEETEAMFEDPTGIPYIGTPAWKTSIKTRKTLAAEHGDIEAVMPTKPSAEPAVPADPGKPDEIAVENKPNLTVADEKPTLKS